MALIVSAATGNFNAGATWVGGVVPTVGDEARASTGHTVTITANVTCDELSNAGTGIFTLNDGVTLTANVTNKSSTVARNCLQFTAAAPAVAYIVGNCRGGGASASGAVVNTSTGTLSITGNVDGGTFNGVNLTNPNPGASNLASGIVNITGSVTGGAGAFAYGVQSQATGTINITGNCTGGIGGSAFGANNGAGGAVNIVGIVTGGAAAAGANNVSTGSMSVTRAVANGFGPGSVGLTAGPGVNNTALGVVEFQEIEFGIRGQSPLTGTGFRLKKANTNVAVFNYADTAGAKTLIDATQNAAMPAASDVRSGVSYASGAQTGSCAVPAAGSVALGVPVDATTGTAVLTPAAVWSHATRTITGGLVDTATTLTNAPTVPTASQIASQVRTELSSELSKISALNTTRLGQCTTTEILGNLLAQANS